MSTLFVFRDISGARAPEKSNFSQTCSLLSQYLKENKAGFGDLGFGNTLNLDAGISPAMDLFPQNTGFGNSVQRNTDISETKQMTIIYGGKVVVFDDVSDKKAKELMRLTSSATLENSTMVNSNSRHIPPHVLGLPHARKASLHRFLEKRKDRINAKAPYQVNVSAAANTKADQTNTWLALSSLAL